MGAAIFIVMKTTFTSTDWGVVFAIGELYITIASTVYL